MAVQIETLVRIGKNGITDNIIAEIKKHLKKNSIVKIKILPNILAHKNKLKLAEELALKSESVIERIVGFTVILKKIKN